MARRRLSTDAVLKELRAVGLAYPGSHTKSPWPGHLDLAVNDKTFAYLSLEGEPLRVSCKLPTSNAVALMLPFCEPAGYGLGKSGWVAANFEGHEPDLAMLEAWLDESYRAQAPKTLIKQLDGGTWPVKKPAANKPAANKPAAKKPSPNKPAANKPVAKKPVAKKPKSR